MTFFASKREAVFLSKGHRDTLRFSDRTSLTALIVRGGAMVLLAISTLLPGAAQAQASASKAQAPATAAPATAQKPSYQEKIDDWQLICVGEAKDKRCSIVKEMTDEKSGQRVVALELGMNGDRLEGAAVLPFGIALARGLAVRFKDGEPGTTVSFQTCLPAGCLAPLSFDLPAIKQLDQSKTLLLSVGLPSGETANFTMPVAGLEKAQARLRVLSKLS